MSTMLFDSTDWKKRAAAIEPSHEGWNVKRYSGIRIMREKFSEITDYESWPTENILKLEHPKTDLIVFRKLLEQHKPNDLPEGTTIWRDSSTFQLDLNAPLNVRKETLYHIGRTERNLKRDWGQIKLVEANDISKYTWYAEWIFHLGRRYPNAPLLTPIHQNLIRRWVLDQQLPPWMKLFSLQVEDQNLAWALCYVWNRRFYYFSPTMTTNPDFAKYGPGKLLTQKLIEKSKDLRLECFDFLQGEHDYKLQWNPEKIPLYSCFIPVTLLGKIAGSYLMLGKEKPILETELKIERMAG